MGFIEQCKQLTESAKRAAFSVSELTEELNRIADTNRRFVHQSKFHK